MKSNTVYSLGKTMKRMVNLAKSDPHFDDKMATMCDLHDAYYNAAVMDVLLEDYKSGKIELTDEQTERVTTIYLKSIEHLAKKLQA